MVRALPILLALAACGDAGGFVEGASLTIPDCAAVGKQRILAPFHMDLTTIAVHESGTVATLRMAAREGSLLEVDQLGLVLYDVGLLRERLRTEDEVVLDLVLGHDDSDTFTFADRETGLLTFVFIETCGPASASLAGLGQLVLTSYGSRDGDLVAGAFEIDIVDRRTGMVLGPDLHGEFNLIVDTAAPHAAFAPHDY